MADITNEQNTEVSENRIICVVKWFNPKYGYGFVKDINSDNDYFAHQSQLQTTINCFKTLYQGEYIECVVTREEQNDKKQASDITGIGRGQLMCEHRNNVNYRSPNNNYSNNYERRERNDY